MLLDMAKRGARFVERNAALYGPGILRASTKRLRRNRGSHQATELYYDQAFADLLEVWANDNAWPEIQFLLRGRAGKVLDVACGTGRTYDFLKDFSDLEYHGCDLSDLLIRRAIERGIARERLRVSDATKMPYGDDEFDFVFSIGSLEHFTEEGLAQTIAECRRVCRGVSFHQVPVSRTNLDEGWITPYQEYWNNSERWWVNAFARAYGPNVWVMNSRWGDSLSRGAWFICVK